MPISKAKPKPVTAAAKITATAPKVAGATPAKSATAAPVVAAVPEPKFKAGDTAIFIKYGDKDQPGIFMAGEEVFVHSSQLVDHPGLKNRKITAFICTKLEDRETAEALTFEQLVADDGPVNAEEVGASKLKVKPVPKVVEEYHPKAVGALVQYVEAGDLTSRIRGLFDQEKRTEFEIGGLLAFVKFEEWGVEEIKALGYEDTTDEAGKTTTAWENYIDGEFNIKYRTADAYIQIYKAFSEIPNFEPSLISDAKNGIGWSKAALIAGYLPPQYDEDGESQKRADELIELARNTPIRELRTEVVTKFSSDGKTTAGTRTGARTGNGKGATTKTWTFKLVDAAATATAQILEIAGKQLGLPADSPKLFETVVNQWAIDRLTPANRARIEGKTKTTAGVSKTAPRPAPVKTAPVAAVPAAA